MRVEPVELTLYGRPWCHLCDDMKSALLALFSADDGIVLHEVNVDSNPVLEERFGDKVPVLLTGSPTTPPAAAHELCHYFLDIERVKQWLSCPSVSPVRNASSSAVTS